METIPHPPKYSTKGFVEKVIARLRDDTAFRAAMTRADNPSTAAQAWRFLLELGNVDLENEQETRAFALVGAAMARERTESNGLQSLGRALQMCNAEPGKIDDSVERRLRRILACDSRKELIPVLRQIIRYVQNCEKVSLDYERLLRDILHFNEKVKIRWASEYYSRPNQEKDEDQTEDPSGKEAS